MMMTMMTMMITTCLGCYFQPLSQGARNGPECATNFGGGGGGFRHQSEKRNCPPKISPAQIPPVVVEGEGVCSSGLLVRCSTTDAQDSVVCMTYFCCSRSLGCSGTERTSADFENNGRSGEGTRQQDARGAGGRKAHLRERLLRARRLRRKRPEVTLIQTQAVLQRLGQCREAPQRPHGQHGALPFEDAVQILPALVGEAVPVIQVQRAGRFPVGIQCDLETKALRLLMHLRSQAVICLATGGGGGGGDGLSLGTHPP